MDFNGRKKASMRGISRYENAYARCTLSARLKVSVLIHLDGSLLLMQEICRAMKL